MPELIPFRWPAEWKDAAKLDLLKGTPFNCLAGEAPPPFPLGDLKFIPLGKDLPGDLILWEGVWPRVLVSKDKDAATASPTGGPWVDSNVGAILLKQATQPGKTVWVNSTPPGGNEVVPLDAFADPIAEAEVYGARWIVTLDKHFVEALGNRSAEGLRAWKRVVSALQFFEARREWRSWEPVTALAVVSSFEGDAKLLSEEFVFLAPRRQLAFHIVPTAEVAKTSFEKFKAVAYLEDEPPQGAVREKLLAFARAGGLLVSPSGIPTTGPSEISQAHAVFRVGKGRVAMPIEKWDDPFTLVRQVHLLLSHREDVVRIWNGGDIDTRYLVSPKGDRGVVHLVPYSSGPTQGITLGFSNPYRTARIHTLDSVTPVKAVKGALGVEIPVGDFTSYAAVEVEA